MGGKGDFVRVIWELRPGVKTPEKMILAHSHQGGVWLGLTGVEARFNLTATEIMIKGHGYLAGLAVV